MSKRIAMVVAGLALVAASGLHAQDAKPAVEHGLGSDTFVFGGSVRIDKPVPGDLISAGGNVDVDATVGGDAVLAGGNLRLNAGVERTVYAAGGRLTIDAPVGRNLRIAGGQIDVGPKGTVAGNVTVGGGQVALRGAIKGAVSVGGGKVLIDAPVDGDVVSNAGHLTLGPNARLGGTLRYRSGDEVERDPAAQVAGLVERMPMPGRGASAAATVERGWGDHARRAGPSWLWTLGLMAIAALLVGTLPVTSQKVADSLRARFGWSLLWGFIALVCIPVAALILLVTIIGIPLALLVLLLYFALLLLGYVSSGIALGQWLLARLKADAAARTGWRVGAAMAAVLALAVVGSIPVVGGLIKLLAMLAGIGAIALLLVPGKVTAAGTPPAPASGV